MVKLTELGTEEPFSPRDPLQHNEIKLGDEEDLTIIRNPAIDAIPEGPLKLLSTVKSLQRARLSALKDHRRAVKSAKRDAIRAAVPARRAQLRAIREERYEARRKELWEEGKPEREAERLKMVKEERTNREKSLWEMSGAELWMRIEDTVAQEASPQGTLVAREDEDHSAFVKRMEALLAATSEIYQIEFQRLENGPIRYFEGIPLNIKYTHPSLVSIMFPPPRLPSRNVPCLNCQVKNMKCSHIVVPTLQKDGTAKVGCARCRRNGETCATRWKTHPDRPRYYYLPDGGSEEEKKDVVGRLWEMRDEQRNGRKALPKWHENDKSENKLDPEYKMRRWWQQLREARHLDSFWKPE